MPVTAPPPAPTATTAQTDDNVLWYKADTTLGPVTIARVGLSGLIGARFVGEKITPAAKLRIPGLTDIPLLGRLLFGEDAFIYLSIALIVGVWYFLYRTRTGLILRAVGDNHVSAHALGYPVLRIRMYAVMFGGACAGLAGAYLPLAYTPFFIPGMTAGRGWIAAGRGDWTGAAAFADEAVSVAFPNGVDEYPTTAYVFALEAAIAMHRGDENATRAALASRAFFSARWKFRPATGRCRWVARSSGRC